MGAARPRYRSAAAPVVRRPGKSEISNMNSTMAHELLRGGREGVKEWNLRRKRGEAIPDLSDGKLSGLSLFRANLSDIRLANADLRATRLSQANLSNATLFGARLPSARLVAL